MKNWKTTIAVIPFLAIAFLIHERCITVRDALTLLAGVGSYLAVVSGDARKGPPTSPA